MPKKFLHYDGTETILKVKHFQYDKSNFEVQQLKRDFVTLFLSVSNGCKMGCKMCFLTYKQNDQYKMLTPEEIIKNNSEICNNLKYNHIKISFMGMGEGVLIYRDLQSIANKVAGNKLYGVEVGTMLPFISTDLEKHLNSLYNGRLFFSLHSADQETRDKLIKSKVSLSEAKSFLQNISIKKVCHYTLIKDVNDSNGDIFEASEFCKQTGSQLRLLEFNKQNKYNKFKSCDRLNEIVELLEELGTDYKLCYSTGKKIKAACGMFF